VNAGQNPYVDAGTWSESEFRDGVCGMAASLSESKN
jgi:hypothetical protein